MDPSSAGQADRDHGETNSVPNNFDLALKEFIKNEANHPGRYETASNMGVMYKKSGEYKMAASHIAKALSIKPGGHMGLGDYYLKMIQWLDANKELDPTSVNFLGVRYADGAEATAKVANKTNVVTLIKNDYRFPDAYMVLGDILLTEGNHQMALRAYVRSVSLMHPSQGAIATRFERIEAFWKKSKKRGQILEYGIGRGQVSYEIGKAEKWLASFQLLEAEHIGENKPADFKTLLAEMEKRGTRVPEVLEAGIYQGSIITLGGSRIPWQRSILIGLAGLVILGAIVSVFVILRRSSHAQNRNPAPE